MLKPVAALLSAVFISGCAVATDPLTIGEQHQLMLDTVVAVDRQKLDHDKPITLHEAMARALLFNFETRLDKLEQDIAADRVAAAYWDFLPKTLASAGTASRDNAQASNSISVTTGNESLESSSSTENTRQTADLRFTWNVLDFGVNYYTMKQTANQAFMAEERHKRIVQELVQDVRSAYWRAVASERLLVDVDAMLAKVSQAIDTANKIQSARLQTPVETLNYKRELYDKLLQLRTIRKGLLTSKLELAKLINIVPSTTYRLAVPESMPAPQSDIGVEPDQLSLIALQFRPEVIEAGYNQRVAELEIKKSIARMFPGLEFSLATNFDSNKYLLHQNWNELGLKVSWNLINMMRGWGEIEMAEKQEVVNQLRRNTLGMAVMAQVNVAYLDYDEAVTTFGTTNSLATIDEELEKMQRDRSNAQNLGELQLIKLELNSLVSKLRRDEQYSNVQGAMGRLMLAVGVSIYDDLPQTKDVTELAAALQDAEQAWVTNGMFRRQYIAASRDEVDEQPATYTVPMGAEKVATTDVPAPVVDAELVPAALERRDRDILEPMSDVLSKILKFVRSKTDS